MKKQYVNPIMTVVAVSQEDAITTSNTSLTFKNAGDPMDEVSLLEL